MKQLLQPNISFMSLVNQRLQEEAIHKYGVVKIDLPEDSEISRAIEEIREFIPSRHLDYEGKDIGGNHITIRYGIEDEDTEQLEAFLKTVKQFKLTFGRTEKFEPSENSGDASVIKIPVYSKPLHELNQKLPKYAPFTKPTFRYSPHTTIAYVNTKVVDKYVGLNQASGLNHIVDSVTVSTADKKTIKVSLKPL